MTETVRKKDYTYSVQVQKSAHISSQFFKNEPSEICSHLSEKGPKGRFFAPDIFEAMVALLVFILATLEKKKH